MFFDSVWCFPVWLQFPKCENMLRWLDDNKLIQDIGFVVIFDEEINHNNHQQIHL